MCTSVRIGALHHNGDGQEHLHLPTQRGGAHFQSYHGTIQHNAIKHTCKWAVTIFIWWENIICKPLCINAIELNVGKANALCAQSMEAKNIAGSQVTSVFTYSMRQQWDFTQKSINILNPEYPKANNTEAYNTEA